MSFFMCVIVYRDDCNKWADYHHWIIKEMKYMIWRVSRINLECKDNSCGVILDFNDIFNSYLCCVNFRLRIRYCNIWWCVRGDILNVLCGDVVFLTLMNSWLTFCQQVVEVDENGFQDLMAEGGT